MTTSAFDTVRAFESELCRYTGARYAVTTNSCTMAILLACAYYRQHHGQFAVSVPNFTYPSVPMSVIHAGHMIKFDDRDWSGEYQLAPLKIWDSARRFTMQMFRPGHMQALSFQAGKILGDSQGGCILHDNEHADAWLRRARFDGRTEGVPTVEDEFSMIGFHCYLSADVATRLLWKLTSADFKRDNPDLPNPEYPDLSKQDAFKPYVALSDDQSTQVYAKYKIINNDPTDEITIKMCDEGSDASQSEQS